MTKRIINRYLRRNVQTRRDESGAARPVPLLPHEHDESPEPASSLDPIERQAHDDVAGGLVDTDRRQDAVQVFERTPGVRKKTLRLVKAG